jgi:hypothetical protein
MPGRSAAERCGKQREVTLEDPQYSVGGES